MADEKDVAATVKINPNDIKIDQHGKIEISNKALADKMKKLLDKNDTSVTDFSAEALLDVNFGC